MNSGIYAIQYKIRETFFSQTSCPSFIFTACSCFT
jgi:hypothetical protein